MARPRQQSLAGMENRKLADLHNVAQQYAGVRDERMELNQREVELKDQLLALMKKHDKREYLCEDVEIRVVAEEETVKVRILKPKEEDEAADSKAKAAGASA